MPVWCWIIIIIVTIIATISLAYGIKYEINASYEKEEESKKEVKYEDKKDESDTIYDFHYENHKSNLNHRLKIEESKMTHVKLKRRKSVFSFNTQRCFTYYTIHNFMCIVHNVTLEGL